MIKIIEIQEGHKIGIIKQYMKQKANIRLTIVLGITKPQSQFIIIPTADNFIPENIIMAQIVVIAHAVVVSIVQYVNQLFPLNLEDRISKKCKIYKRAELRIGLDNHDYI
jgi:hypothetical protein